MADQTPKSHVPMRRSLRVLLFASLALNLTVAGLFIGASFASKKGGGKLPRDGDFMGAFTRALPDEDRRAIGRNIRDHHRKSGVKRDGARRDFQALVSMLRTTPFEPSAIQAQLESQARSNFDRRLTAQLIWLERVSAMTDAQRADYADQIEAQISRLGRSKPARAN